MASDDDSSDLSSLSSLSPVPSDAELDGSSDNEESKSQSGILKFFSKVSDQSPKSPSPPPRKRSPSPAHEYVLADNPDIAFIVMFRSRFSDAFAKSLPNFGPQELERDVVEAVPGDRVEYFLCGLLGLLLNRKQDVKPGHYNRALEDAISSHKGQWDASWEEKSPLSGGASFNTMSPTERLTLLRTLILWTMSSSDVVKSIINQAYKQNRHEDDMNQPRAVQPWGSDGDRRRYFLVEGQDDTAFRVYRESNPAGLNRTWWSVAGSIEELKALAEKLENKDGGPKAMKLSSKMHQAIPRFEAGEEKRRRREYRQMRKEQFKRPEPGFSMYEGRTRGKRVKYTYSDDEDVLYSDSTGYRRSSRNTGTNTPADSGPVTTSSGRQIRAPPRLNPMTGEDTADSAQGEMSEFDQEGSVGPTGRPRRSAAPSLGTNGLSESRERGNRGHSMDSDEPESEADFGDDEDDVDAHVPEESDEDEEDFDAEEAMGEDDLGADPKSLVVKLEVMPPKLRTVLSPVEPGPNVLPTPDGQDSLDWKVKPETPVSPLVDMPDAPPQEGVAQDAPTVAPETKPAEIQTTSDTRSTAPAPVGETRTSDAAQPGTPEKTTEAEDDSMSTVTSGAPNAVAMPSTSLAFRGSPEKPHAQPLPITNTFQNQE